MRRSGELRIMDISHCKILLLCVLVAWLPESSLAVHCYQCGAEDGTDFSISCDIFAIAPMWRPFEVECPTSPPHFCIKTVTHIDGYEPREVRGCAPAENAYHVPHLVGCSRIYQGDSSETDLCLCDGHLCNDARPSITIPTPLWAIILLVICITQLFPSTIQ